MSRRSTTPHARGRSASCGPTGVPKSGEYLSPPILTPQRRGQYGGPSLARKKPNLNITPLFQKDFTRRTHSMSPLHDDDLPGDRESFTHRPVLSTPPGARSPRGYGGSQDGGRPKTAKVFEFDGSYPTSRVGEDFDEGEYVSPDDAEIPVHTESFPDRRARSDFTRGREPTRGAGRVPRQRFREPDVSDRRQSIPPQGVRNGNVKRLQVMRNSLFDPKSREDVLGTLIMMSTIMEILVMMGIVSMTMTMNTMAMRNMAMNMTMSMTLTAIMGTIMTNMKRILTMRDRMISLLSGARLGTPMFRRTYMLDCRPGSCLGGTRVSKSYHPVHRGSLMILVSFCRLPLLPTLIQRLLKCLTRRPLLFSHPLLILILPRSPGMSWKLPVREF